jgi:hypothetical protein
MQVTAADHKNCFSNFSVKLSARPLHNVYLIHPASPKWHTSQKQNTHLERHLLQKSTLYKTWQVQEIFLLVSYLQKNNWYFFVSINRHRVLK